MGLSLPKSNLIFLKKCLDKWVHFNTACHGRGSRHAVQRCTAGSHLPCKGGSGRKLSGKDLSQQHLSGYRTGGRTPIIDQMNTEVLHLLGVQIEKREEYAIEYVEDILRSYAKTTSLDVTKFVSGKGHRKGIHQK